MNTNNTQIPIVTARPITKSTPAPQMILVQVPPGVQAGTTVQVQAPDGRLINAQVPPGVSQFYVSLPTEVPQIPVVPAYPVNATPQPYINNNMNYGHSPMNQPYGYNNNSNNNNNFQQPYQPMNQQPSYPPPYGGGYNNNPPYQNYPPNRMSGAMPLIAGVALAGTAGYLLGDAMSDDRNRDYDNDNYGGGGEDYGGGGDFGGY